MKRRLLIHLAPGLDDGVKIEAHCLSERTKTDPKKKKKEKKNLRVRDALFPVDVKKSFIEGR